MLILLVATGQEISQSSNWGKAKGQKLSPTHENNYLLLARYRSKYYKKVNFTPTKQGLKPQEMDPSRNIM